MRYDEPTKTKHRLARAAGLAAVLVLSATLAVWATTGANLGWTKTSAIVMQHDEVTGIDYPVHQPAFVAGVEVLALGFGTAGLFAAASLFARRLRPVRA